MVMPLRVGESFVTDANRFAQAALYATDMGADVIQEALGTYNAPYFARQAIEYAYHHGTTVIASAADEAAEHHNQPGSLPDTIVVNSVNAPEENLGPVNATGNSYLELNGCTNWGPRVDLSVEGSSCSSEFTGKSAGHRLIYSAAENALTHGKISALQGLHARRRDALHHHPQRGAPAARLGEHRRGRQRPVRPARAPARRRLTRAAAARPTMSTSPRSPRPRARRLRCRPARTRTPTDLQPPTDAAGGVIGLDTSQYPARKGFDQFYGYGRLNAYKAVGGGREREHPARGRTSPRRTVEKIDPSLRASRWTDTSTPAARTPARSTSPPASSPATRPPPPAPRATSTRSRPATATGRRPTPAPTTACWHRLTSPT